MSYQALYRVWRPQTFGDVIGQNAVTQTLKNALISGQTSHAYLFCGPRGTGKTSVAKILAKALNCLHLQDGEPDNTCEICQAITNGSMTDVIEIDAASNNGVDEIRDIRDKAKYAPTMARVKVYIIDEVHMLSTGAFNALLKTLEEPPAHVVFILATTEPQKIPATIISRTQRFDFRRITTEDIVGRLETVLADKQITYDDHALAVIARAAEGGMRDALSILDQVLSFGQNHVTVENALDVTGGVATAQLGEYLQAVHDHDVAKALTTVESLLAAGKDAGRLIEDLISYLRDLMVYQQAPSLLAATETELIDAHFKPLAQAFDVERLAQMISILNDTSGQLRLTNHPTIYLEVATVRLGEATVAKPVATPQAPSADVTALEQQVQHLQQTVATLQQTGVAKPVKRHQTGGYKPNLAKIYLILGKATRKDLEALKDVWPDLLSMLSVSKRAMMKISEPVAASPDGVIVSFDYDILVERGQQDAALMAELKDGLQRLTQKQFEIVLVQSAAWPTLRKEYLQTNGAPAKAKQPAKPTTPPVVKALSDMFGEADNITVTDD
ncbi:DNA polymerase III subunit gamma/tau [Lacticaseibacillus sp. N501-2]|uniref:DNA polymerase III subunit gamma/tau n=1 Tax=Lacticaseibacillus salsurae TaxID=3367729 RepID=UPI0038B2BD9F